MARLLNASAGLPSHLLAKGVEKSLQDDYLRLAVIAK
jgi:hypothetical protein